MENKVDAQKTFIYFSQLVAFDNNDYFYRLTFTDFIKKENSS